MKYNMNIDVQVLIKITSSNNKCGFIDNLGKTVIPCIYDWVGEYINGYTQVKLNNKYGYINKEGKEIK